MPCGLAPWRDPFRDIQAGHRCRRNAHVHRGMGARPFKQRCAAELRRPRPTKALDNGPSTHLRPCMVGAEFQGWGRAIHFVQRTHDSAFRHRRCRLHTNRSRNPDEALVTEASDFPKVFAGPYPWASPDLSFWDVGLVCSFVALWRGADSQPSVRTPRLRSCQQTPVQVHPRTVMAQRVDSRLVVR